MKTLLLLSVVLLANFSMLAQGVGFRNVEPGDTAFIGRTILTHQGHTMKDGNGKLLEFFRDDQYYIFNGKNVPSGFYCDTSIDLVDGGAYKDLRYIKISLFMDRKMIFSTYSIAMHKWVYSVYIDTAFYNRILNLERSVATGAQSGK